MEAQVLALIICDDVIDDRVTNKKSLIGLFNNISARSFPIQHHQMVVYLAMTGHGEIPIKIEMVHAEDITEETGPILQLEKTDFIFNDPNAVVELVFKLQGIPFPRPGLYQFRVRSDNHLLTQRDFLVHQVEGDLK
jgi:hypothetical protein